MALLCVLLESLVVISVVIIVLSLLSNNNKACIIFYEWIIYVYTLSQQALYVEIMKFVQWFYYSHFISAAQTNWLTNYLYKRSSLFIFSTFSI